MSGEQGEPGYFAVSWIHRDDIATVLVDNSVLDEERAIKFAAALTDEDMSLIASKLGEGIMTDWWYVLSYYLQHNYGHIIKQVQERP